MSSRLLKVDLHTHASGDPHEKIDYTPYELIDVMAAQGFDAVAISNHDCDIYCRQLADYAMDKGVLLIRGFELTYERQHILLINFKDAEDIQTPGDIIKRKAKDNLVIAPHPYYPFVSSCGSLLDSMPSLFDAVEHAYLYINNINFNTKALRRANKLKLPVVGNSDAHDLRCVGYTYSLIDSDLSVEGIVKAVKQGRVKCVSEPLPFLFFMGMVIQTSYQSLKRISSQVVRFIKL